MSFLIESTARRMATMPIPVTRTVLLSGPRSFSTTPLSYRTPTETMKDGIKTVDRAVSDKLVEGLNAGETVAQKAKKLGDQVAGKTAQSTGEAKGAAHEAAGKAKGTAQEAAGKAKGTAQEAAGKAKGTAQEVKKNVW